MYQASCASCHLPDLGGRNEAPPLAGANFMNTWRTRTTRDLFEFIQSDDAADGREPQRRSSTSRSPRSSSRRTARRQAPRPFTPTTAVPIGSVADGRRRPAGSGRRTRRTPPRRRRGGATAAGARAPAAAACAPANAGPLGITVAGEVKNYVPVTDEMLRNQDPGDWLMARRNYQGWSYSPLTQITRDNVKDLQLAWVWAMNEGQGNEPTPSSTTASSTSPTR